MFFALQACSATDRDPNANTTDTPAPFPEASARDLQTTLNDAVKAEVAPGVAVAVQRPGYELWSGAAGVADIETRSPLTTSQRFRAGSVLKTAVATAVLQLVEHGKLSLESSVSQLLPGEITRRVHDADRITLRMLLDHTSGIPEFDDADFNARLLAEPTHIWALNELLDRAFALPATFPPGGGFSYSNTDYVLLGQIIERAVGQPWRQVVRERVFARVGLSHSSLPEEGNSRCDGCSRGYESIENQLIDATEVDPSMAGPAGGDALVSSTQDLAKFLGELAKGKLFDAPATLELMLAFVDAPIPEEATTGYGLGVARFQMGDTQLFGHLGGAVGFQSFMLYEPGSGTVVSGYMNRTGDLGSFVIPVVAAVGRALSRPSSLD
jgi:D-alanyl-D-alanine carboxypeptidase